VLLTIAVTAFAGASASAGATTRSTASVSANCVALNRSAGFVALPIQ
jgi:hypothetical protein